MVIPKKAKSLPKPFSRPAIELVGTVKRSWQTVDVAKLKEGDLIPDHGLVKHLSLAGGAWLVKFISGEEMYYAALETVFAFTE